jgi:jouberin
LLKSDPERPVTRYNEPKYINYILPTITRAFDLHSNCTKTPIWQDCIMLNESYLNVITPNVVVLFEIVDFVTHLKKNPNGGPWHRVAWAFLKLVGNTGNSNTEKDLRLQLYSYSKNTVKDTDKTPGVFHSFRTTRNIYPSTLYVMTHLIDMLKFIAEQIQLNKILI